MEKRRHKRLNCTESCQLHLNDLIYHATLLNISFQGLLVHCNSIPPDSIRTGNKCGVLFSNAMNSGEFDCEVVRVEAGDIALQLMGID